MSKKFPSDYPSDSGIKMHQQGNYWFYHKETYPNDAPLYYHEILSQAITSIEIWDPYINTGQNDFQIFSSVNDEITIKLLTSSRLNSRSLKRV